jgi:hypothetical protein
MFKLGFVISIGFSELRSLFYIKSRRSAWGQKIVSFNVLKILDTGLRNSMCK